MNVTTGFLGWGNLGCHTNSSLDCYGPGGRWADGKDEAANPPMGGRSGQCGDLLADALARVGEYEGASLVVVSISRREQQADPGLAQRVEQAIRAACLPLPAAPEEPPRV